MSTSQTEKDDVAAKRARRMRTMSKEIEKFIQPEWDTLKNMQENMKDSNDALSYLTYQLYFEDTMEVNLENLSYALMLFSVTSDLRLVQEGARAVAILMRELSGTVQNEQAEEVIKDILTPIKADLESMRQDLREIKESNSTPGAVGIQPTYANTARKGREVQQATSAEIKRRQILMDQEEGMSIDTLSTLTEIQLVAKANETIEIAKIEKNGKDLKIISARKLRNGGLLLETNNGEAADTIRSRKEDFCRAFGPAVTIKDRVHMVRLSFVPVTHDVNSEWEHRRIEENSGLEKGNLLATSWVKAIQNRRKDQQVAMLMAKFSTPQAANKAIREGIIIQGRRVQGHKAISGPMRCYHCQRYGHTAAKCPYSRDQAKCPTCAGTHERNQCTAKEEEEYKCVSCNVTGHTAWNPDCPTYRRELEKIIQNNEENRYKYFRTNERWTHEIDPIYMVRGEEARMTDRYAAQEPAESAQEEEERDEIEAEMEIEEGEVEDGGWSTVPKKKAARGPYTQRTLETFGYARRNTREEAKESEAGENE